MRAFLRNPSAVAGLAMVSVLVLAAGISIFWTPYDPLKVSTMEQWVSPSWSHLLGTDALGRDIFSSMMVGAQVTLFATILATSIATLIGLALSFVIVATPPVLSSLVQRFVDILVAFPTLVLAIVLVTSFGSSATTAAVAIGLGSAVVITRTVLPELRTILESDFVLLAKAGGASSWWVMRRHAIPNIAPTLIVRVTQIMSLAALAEAGLSYLGFGTPAPSPSWGRALADMQTQVLLRPEVLIAPSVAIILVTLGFNLLGDGFRDAMDVRTTRRKSRR